ncbi:MAG: hypothetical protein C7B45_16965 [Sulfobacillus acidophilus]|uniref:Uncharacterized protein n=1 Tax=Sulfobacillus acidophilus TaxID=53633 RepID=A0A2T2WCQ1_9FIRM|nr:MAG: hypothetical protein C7B45_16965 [Sulfobacillus acidophilus]
MSQGAPILMTRARLKSERFWTDALIRRYLGTPDHLAPNPHYRSGPPMTLYNLDRVIACEQQPEVAQALQRVAERRPQRQRAAQDAAERQRRAVLDWVRAQTIHIPVLPHKVLIRQACDHYNALWMDRGRDDKWATPSDDPAFLARIAVNYLRHACSPYEDRLDDLFGQIGATEGRLLLEHRVLTAIAQQYPALAAECQRQKKALNAD